MATPAAKRSAAGACLLIVGIAYAIAHHIHSSRPTDLAPVGWWTWYDQGHYLRAALAWATGDLRPSHHFYFPGYALLGAALGWLTPEQPFYVVDLVCLLFFGATFLRIARRLFPDWAWCEQAAGAVFAAVLVGSYWLMKSFVEPWTTTPTAPLTCLSLSAALDLVDRPTTKGAALLGFTTAAVVLFRPTDFLILLVVVAPAAIGALLRANLPLKQTTAIAAAGVVGAIIPALFLGGTYLLVYGVADSDYLAGSRRIGFEWRLIPLRWVTLFVSPRPLFLESGSMAQAFPWIVPGIAGMVLMLAKSSSLRRIHHVIVVSAIAVHILVYLSYRDLHAQGLFRFGNYHYFKWTLPFFGLYAVALSAALRHARAYARELVLAGACVLVLFCWRAEWVTIGQAEGRVEPPRTLILENAPRMPWGGVRLRAQAPFSAVFNAPYIMRAGTHDYASNDAIKAFPITGGFVLTTLRSVEPGEARINFAEGVVLDPDAVPEQVEIRLSFGLPEWRALRRVPKRK